MQFPSLNDIQKRRKILSLTQNRLSKSAGISQSLLTKIERGEVIPSYKIAVDIFNILDQFEHADEKLAKDVMHKNVIVLENSDTVQRAVNFTKTRAISQFPVVDGNKIVGSIASVDLIGKAKTAKIKEVVKEPFPTINENTPLSVVKSILRSTRAVVVLDNAKIKGIITAEDVI